MNWTIISVIWVIDWDLKWKINSKQDTSKQTPEFAFSEKSKKITLLSLFFNNIQLTQSSS